MLAARSTHKRKRSSGRRDAAFASPTASRVVVSVVQGSSGDGGGCSTAIDLIAAHPFTSQIDITVPLMAADDVSKVTAILNGLDESRSYTARISPLLLIDPIFVTSYVKRGHLLLLSAGRLDNEDVICIDGTGKLTLSLTKDTYQTLGLQGQAYKRSQTSSGRGGDRLSGASDRYVVIIELLAPHFTPGKPGYERTKERLRAWDAARGDANSIGSWDVVMNWAQDSRSTGDSVQLPQRYATSAALKEVRSKCEVERVQDVWLPGDHLTQNLGRGWKDSGSQEAWLDLLSTFTEWNSLAVMDAACIRTFARPDEINSYEVATPRTAGILLRIRYSGFLPPRFGLKLASAIPAIQRAAAAHFVNIHATGFADAPISWTRRTPDVKSTPSLPRPGDEVEGASDSSVGSTGPAARRKRNKQRRKRGHTNAEHLGHQVRNAHSSVSVDGWQICFLFQPDSTAAITIQTIGDPA